MTKRKFSEKKLGRHLKGVDWKNNPERVIVSKFDGYCSTCFEDISAGEWVFWSSESKEIRHQKCPTPEVEMKIDEPEPDDLALAREQHQRYKTPGWKITPTVHPPRTPLSGDRDLLADVGALIPPEVWSQMDK